MRAILTTLVVRFSDYFHEDAMAPRISHEVSKLGVYSYIPKVDNDTLGMLAYLLRSFVSAPSH